jgi:hypothetical protein
MSSTTLTHVPSTRSVRPAGAWCLAGGLLGAAEGLAMLAWSPQVSDDSFSYPFNDLWYVIAQTSFFVQHVLLVVGVAALLRLPAVRASRTALIATGAAAVGLVLLAVDELVALSVYDAATDSPRARLVENLYAPPVMLIGVGLLVAGIALVRRGGAGAGCVRLRAAHSRDQWLLHRRPPGDRRLDAAVRCPRLRADQAGEPR